MEKLELKLEYENLLPKFRRTATNVREAVGLFLNGHFVSHLAILSRVKGTRV
jgi:hypothetical protein